MSHRPTDDGAKTNGLPRWAAAFAVGVSALLISKALERELELRAGDLYPLASPYLEHPSLTRVHLVSGALLAVFGFVQFIPRFRTRRAAIHRWNGRFVMATGAVAAISGIWINIAFYPGSIFPHLGGYFFGVGVLVSVALGFLAIRRGDVFTHREWMSRAMAVVIAAGLQRFFMEIWELVIGPHDPASIGFCLWIAAGIVLSINELLLRRARRTS